jgi:Ca2+-binding RTX toxin-like protein
MIGEDELEIGTDVPEAYWEFNADTNTFTWLKEPDAEVMNAAISILGLVDETAQPIIVDAADLSGGDNTLIGGVTHDRLSGNVGSDLIHAAGGNDVVHGSGGSDGLFGQDGNDEVFGDGGDDLVSGGEGNDALYGGDGDDLISGGAGNDALHSGPGNDALIGGAGDDIAFFNGNFESFSITKAANGVIEVRGATGAVTLRSVEVLTFADQSFGIDVVNFEPKLEILIADKTGSVGQDLSFTLPGSTFSDGNGDDLEYTATLSNGAALPSWLTFNEDTLSFSGTPGSANVGSLIVMVTASDGFASASDSFQLSIGSGRGPDINGTSLGNWLVGTSVDETIRGLGGNDTIKGGAGNDTIFGGVGGDDLWGEAGADTFVYRSIRESPWKNGKFDLIRDFNNVEDSIDLGGIDANTSRAGNQAFNWVGYSNKWRDQGQLDYWHHGGNTYVFAHVDRDAKPDFQITIEGKIRLDAGDFIL